MQFVAKEPEPPRPTATGALGVAYNIYYDPYRWYRSINLELILNQVIYVLRLP